jgi:glycosyltransferase involved in cell wall biosynthesis
MPHLHQKNGNVVENSGGLLIDNKIQVLRLVIGLNQGGVQQGVLNLARSLDHERINLIACAIENGGLIAEEIMSAGSQVIVLGYKRQPIKTITSIFQIIKKYKIDIVHASSYHPSLYGRVAAVLAGVPVVMSYEHSIFDHYRPIRAFLNRCLNYWTHAYTAVGYGVANQVLSWYGYQKEKVFVVHNGVDTDKFSPVLNKRSCKNALGLDEDALVVGMVGRLDFKKGYQFFFEAIKQIKASQKIEWIVVGGGRNDSEILHAAKVIGVQDRVNFLGVRRDINVCMRAIDIFCFPTLQEGFPNVLLEAMASACAVIASDHPGNLEVLENQVNGLVVNRADSCQIANAIERYIDSPALRERMGLAARKTIEANFSISRYGVKMTNLYLDLWEQSSAK